MEYLLVHFIGSPRSRRVMINGVFNGRTGAVIQLDAGTHTITLGPPANFMPAEFTVVLKDTAVLAPLEVTFERLP